MMVAVAAVGPAEFGSMATPAADPAPSLVLLDVGARRGAPTPLVALRLIAIWAVVAGSVAAAVAALPVAGTRTNSVPATGTAFGSGDVPRPECRDGEPDAVRAAAA